MKKNRVHILLQTLIFLMVMIAWCRMTFGYDAEGRLSAPGIHALKYFTVLSNLLAALGAIVYLWQSRKQPSGKILKACILLRLSSVVSVAITFLVVLTFLGPVWGFASSYTGANLWFHLVVPILATVDLLWTKDAATLHPREACLAVLPLIVYAVGYLVNILVNGIGAWPYTNDFYGFLTWGYPIGICLLLALIGVAIGIAQGICAWSRHSLSKRTRLD